MSLPVGNVPAWEWLREGFNCLGAGNSINLTRLPQLRPEPIESQVHDQYGNFTETDDLDRPLGADHPTAVLLLSSMGCDEEEY